MLALLALGRLSAWFEDPEDDEPSLSFDTTPDDFFSPPRRVSVMSPKSFEDAQGLADCFKREQLVIVNLRNVNGELAKRMVDFCAGLTYALGGQVQPITNQLLLLTPRDVKVLDEQDQQLIEREFFNQL